MPAETIVAIIVLGGMVLVVLVSIARLLRGRKREPLDPLDHVLFWWTPDDPVTVRRLLEGNLILGRTGSGKSSSSLKMIARAIIRYAKSGGIILAGKVDEVAMWRELFKLAGREKDLIVFCPTEKWRINCVDYILKSGGRAKDVSKFLMLVGESMRSNDSDGQEDSKFWEKQNERLIYLAVTVLWLAHGNVTVPNLQRFINGAALHPSQFANEEWTAGFHNECLKAAFGAKKTPIEEHDLQLAMEYWLGEYPTCAEKTRSSIIVGVMGILHTYNSGWARELLSTETNFKPEDTLNGAFILVNTPPAEWGDTGCLCNAAVKYLTQRCVLRREAKPDDFINVIIGDEFHQYVNSGDAHYLSMSRGHLGTMLVITQSVSSLYGAMGGEKGRHLADALMANFTTTIVHACDPITAEWASTKQGRVLQTFVGTSMAPVEDIFNEMLGFGKTTTSTNEHWDKEIETKTMMNGLRTGGKAAGFKCDAVVMRSGEAFSNSKNWLLVEFSQK